MRNDGQVSLRELRLLVVVRWTHRIRSRGNSSIFIYLSLAVSVRVFFARAMVELENARAGWYAGGRMLLLDADAEAKGRDAVVAAIERGKVVAAVDCRSLRIQTAHNLPRAMIALIVECRVVSPPMGYLKTGQWSVGMEVEGKFEVTGERRCCESPLEPVGGA